MTQTATQEQNADDDWSAAMAEQPKPSDAVSPHASNEVVPGDPMLPTSPSWPPRPLRISPRTRNESLTLASAKAPSSSVRLTLPSGAPTSESLRPDRSLAAGPAENLLLPSSLTLKLSPWAPKSNGSSPLAIETLGKGVTLCLSAPRYSGLA